MAATIYVDMISGYFVITTIYKFENKRLQVSPLEGFQHHHKTVNCAVTLMNESSVELGIPNDGISGRETDGVSGRTT